MRVRRSLVPFVSLVAALFLTTPCAQLSFAQNPKSEPPKVPPPNAAGPPSASSPAAQLTSADADGFFGGFLPAMLDREDVAGSVVIVVKDGKVLFSHGYGYSDVERKTPVSVDDTLFRPGSVSKLFTCTAVMQLVEQGKLDLDRDVNTYIDFRIPATYSDPVTLRRIMTHTAGFEEWDKELFVAKASDLEPLDMLLPKHLPARIFAPGTMPAYSNYAMTLAGYIVQRVSGEKFEDYIANHIYKPLGMAHSTFEQPLPANLRPLMSRGYARASGKAKDFEFVNGPPAGSMSTSAADIAKFMIAHLQNGKVGSIQILKPETAELMHTRAFGPVPELNGMALPFFQENQNGHRIVGHGGDTQYFHSHLSLILDANVGFFISLNSAGRGETNIRGLLWNKFLDRYFPGAPALPAADSTAAAHNKEVSGTYITSRRGETTLTKSLAVLGEVTFSPQSDATISSPQLLGVNGQPRHWREISPYLYRDIDGQGKIAFRRNAAGNLEIFSDSAAAGLQRVSFLASGKWRSDLQYFAIATLGLAVVLWPISALVRKHFQRPLALGLRERRLRAITRVICLFDLGVLLGWTELFAWVGADISRANRHNDYLFHGLQVCGWIALIATIIPIIYAIGAWTSKSRWRCNRVLDALVALGCVAPVWSLWMLNLFVLSAKY
ncbi:MAG TPA: serine hydrolase domain-containing protein [Candidatus Acidoferrales bacterium]|nr:serine hydrolase domain-containing protein [Candidatus Acidoferrales bacterium]